MRRKEVCERRVVGLRPHGLFRECQGGDRLKLQRRQSRADEQCRGRLGSCRAFGEAGVSAARLTRSLQQGRFGGPQCIVMLVFFECLIQIARSLADVAGAHPNKLRQAVVRLGEARLQSHAFAQGQLGLIESLQSDEAASMRVVQRRRRSGAAQCLTHHALTLLRLVGRIQRDRQGMGCDGVVRSECHETTIVRHRFALAAQSGVCRHVQRRQFLIGLAAIAPRRCNVECRCRLARVEEVANQ